MGDNSLNVVLTELNKPLAWEEVELTPLQFGQVKVRILTSGLCGAQLQEIAGLKGNAGFLPHLMGHEGCGIIEEVGQGVRLKVGQKVVMHWMKGAGIESDFPSYIFRGKKISSGKVTTLGEYSICSENRLTPVPDETPNGLCSLLGCGMTTAFGAINNEAAVKIGERVLILGCGGLGLNLAYGSRLVGAGLIEGVDIEDKSQLFTLNGGHFFYQADINDYFLAAKYDVIFDTTGHAPLIEQAIPLLDDEGRFVLIGQPKTPVSFTSSLFGAKGKRIIASQGGKTNPAVDIPRYVGMSLDFSRLITHSFPMEEINKAVKILRAGKCGRIILYAHH